MTDFRAICGKRATSSTIEMRHRETHSTLTFNFAHEKPVSMQMTRDEAERIFNTIKINGLTSFLKFALQALDATHDQEGHA